MSAATSGVVVYPRYLLFGELSVSAAFTIGVVVYAMQAAGQRLVVGPVSVWSGRVAVTDVWQLAAGGPDVMRLPVDPTRTFRFAVIG